MRGVPPTVVPLDTHPRAFRAIMSEEIEDSQGESSSSNSPTRAEYEESDFFEGNNDSQSSIGVQTFQDMAVNEVACVAPINRLPPEILIHIFSKIVHPADLLTCMLVSKTWAYNSVGLLWHRPACTNWTKHSAICSTLGLPQPYFAYRDFIKRLNLAALAERVNDGSVVPLAVCTKIERLTLTNCVGLTDMGLTTLLNDSTNLLALDISGVHEITEASMMALAAYCTKLQGLNVTGCTKITNESMIAVAENCRALKRLKLNDCSQMQDPAIIMFANNCANLLEIDLHQCRLIGNDPIISLLQNGRHLRELRLANCELITDAAFLSLRPNIQLDALRILDLTSCVRLTDRSVEKIIDAAPRLRNLVLAKCRNITDIAVNAISKLGKNLHYLHLGHCGQITDEAVIKLVSLCNRIRYIDLGCCIKLTDASVMKLAVLPKLRRIGLVKCHLITNESVYALAQVNRRLVYGVTASDPNFPHAHLPTLERLGMGPLGAASPNYSASLAAAHAASRSSTPSSLERVHLSYCTNLTLDSIIVLLNSCPRLTHLSLTGVHAFLRDDLESFCREAPPEFTEHQRNVFCVFSGQGVIGLRRHLNGQNIQSSDGRGRFGAHGRVRDDDDLTMTGMMAGAAIDGATPEADGDDAADDEVDEEQLEDISQNIDGLVGLN